MTSRATRYKPNVAATLRVELARRQIWAVLTLPPSCSWVEALTNTTMPLTERITCLCSSVR